MVEPGGGIGDDMKRMKEPFGMMRMTLIVVTLSFDGLDR